MTPFPGILYLYNGGHFKDVSIVEKKEQNRKNGGL